MNFNLKRPIISVFLGAVMMVFVFGCAQHDDVIQPQNRASITLRPTNLPVLDTLYIYELWTLSVDGTDSTFTSLGKFLWDSYRYRLVDTAGAVIDSVFEIPGAWEDHDFIVVTIENRNDPSPLPSGTIMLIDEVIDPSTRPVSLHFPADFSMTAGYYFVASPSDDDDYNDEEKGLWVCARASTERFYQDTLAVDTLPSTVDGDGRTTYTRYAQVVNETRQKTDPDTIGVVSWTVFDSVIVMIGYDTIWDHVRIDVVWNDTIDTIYDYNLTVIYDTANWTTHMYYNYAGPLEELPDVSPYGWRYNTWVFHEYFPTAANLPKMVPFGFERQQAYVADTTWGVLALGAFYDQAHPDLSNPYTDTKEVPQFPGEDFLVGTGALSGIDLRYDGTDATGGQWGSVVIGVEPIPRPGVLTVDTTRNFPIFVLSDFLRSASHVYKDPTDTTDQYPDVDWVHTFHNWNQFLPRIGLEVRFHE